MVRAQHQQLEDGIRRSLLCLPSCVTVDKSLKLGRSGLHSGGGPPASRGRCQLNGFSCGKQSAGLWCGNAGNAQSVPLQPLGELARDTTWPEEKGQGSDS